MNTNAARCSLALGLVLLALAPRREPAFAEAGTFAWPEGKRAAISLSFDDARASQLTEGVPLFKEYGTRVTFFLTGNAVASRAAEWRAAAAAGHELANHSMTHPCTGHFRWSRARALEEYTAERIEAELHEANAAIAKATGVTPVTFAYPCGQTFFGRGESAASYIPVVSRTFLAGRSFGDEVANDVSVIDLARVLGVSSDDLTFEAMRPMVDDAVANGHWLVFGGHDIGLSPGRQVTRTDALRVLLEYVKEPARGIWIDTVATVAAHVKRSARPQALGAPRRER